MRVYFFKNRVALIIILFLMVTLFYACLSNNNLETKNNLTFDDIYGLNAGEELDIIIDSETDFFTTCLQYHEDGGDEYITFLNRYTNSVYNYNIGAEVLNKWVFPIEGPMGVGKIDGFYLYTLDSIFTISSHQYLLSLTHGLSSKKNKQVQKIRLLKDQIGESTCMPFSDTPSRMIVKDDFLYIVGIPDFDLGKKGGYKKGNNYIIYNLKNNSLEYMNLYNVDYYDKLLPPQYSKFSQDFNQVTNQIIISAPFSNELLVIDGNNLSLKKRYYAGSKYVGTLLGMDDLDYSIEKRQKFYIENPSYTTILYDKFRNVYYRFVELPNETAIANNEERKVSKTISITILDGNFNKIGEQLLPKYQYISNMAFVGKKGLYISKPKMKNFAPDEEIMSFTLLKLIEK